MELPTSRPRVLGWLRSAAILDGDWGTSIAYVLGISFALAGYNSGWHLFMMLLFTGMVAANYVTICRLYPGGGGVYSSVRHRSQRLAVIGALLLGADYTVTASLSVLDAFHYMGLASPHIWAIGMILSIGALNWFGPRHAGSVAIVISTATLLGLLILVVYASPYAVTHFTLELPTGSILDNWKVFAGIILAISGIEAVSNLTGIMKDPAANSRHAILVVFGKISLVTIVLAFAMLAIPSLSRTEHTEEMIRFLGATYVGPWFGPVIGIVLGFLLISAGNTAINAMISIQFLMSIDGELPAALRRLNRFGVPIIPVVIATLIPIIVLVLIHDIITLSQLYAIGVVGAILINVGSTATDKSLTLPTPTRSFMMASAVILLLIEATIAVTKVKALIFALSVLAVGLLARELARRQARAIPIPGVGPVPIPAVVYRAEPVTITSKMMVAVRGGSERLLRHACEEAKLRGSFLFILHVKQLSVMGLLPDKVPGETLADTSWMESISREYTIPFRVISILSSEVGYTIAEQAATFGIDRLLLGATQRTLVEKALRGDVIRTVSELLPEEIQLVIYRA